MAEERSMEQIHAVVAETAAPEIKTRRTVNWPHVGAFLGLAFGLTWLINLAMYLNGGLSHPAAKLLLQFQMLIPAFSAMLLGMFFFPESPIYFKTNRTASRWFIYYYYFMTLAYLAAAVVAFLQPALLAQVGGPLMLLGVVGLVLVLILRWRGGPRAFAGAGMGGGNWRIWVLYGLGIVLFCLLEALLNYLLKLGQPADIRAMFPPGAADNVPTPVLIASTAFNMLVTGPLLGLIVAFGEEYGWRGYLQTELVRLGRVRGVGLLGVIWGIWHWPVIWMGYNYPGQPLVGSVLMVLFTVILAYVLAYAVFKSKGVWTAAYLHGLFNQSLSFTLLAVYLPASFIMSFSIGLPGLLLAVPIVLLILRDPVWKETD